MKRVFFGILLVLGLVILGFGLAMALAAEIVYPGSANLDRGLARLELGLGGAAVGFAAGLVLAFALQPPLVLRIALAALLLGGLILGLIAWRAQVQREAGKQSRQSRHKDSLITANIQGFPPRLLITCVV